jgi:hypothetical protein
MVVAETTEEVTAVIPRLATVGLPAVTEEDTVY